MARTRVRHDAVLPLDRLFGEQSSADDQSRKSEEKSGQSSEPPALGDVVGVELERVVVLVSLRSERVIGKRLY